MGTTLEKCQYPRYHLSYYHPARLLLSATEVLLILPAYGVPGVLLSFVSNYHTSPEYQSSISFVTQTYRYGIPQKIYHRRYPLAQTILAFSGFGLSRSRTFSSEGRYYYYFFLLLFLDRV